MPPFVFYENIIIYYKKRREKYENKI
jgi:hypothetical protein